MSESFELNYYRVYHDGCLLKNAKFFKNGNVWYVIADKTIGDVNIALVDKANKCVYYYVDWTDTHYLQRWAFVRDILLTKRRMYEISTQKNKERTQDWTQESEKK